MSPPPASDLPASPSANSRSRLWRGVLLAVGLLCTLLGVVGIFLPLLPTVPFLLLAAACFARSSERIHRWLINHVHLGPMIAGFLDGRGIPRKAKVRAITLVWLTIPPSALWLVSHPWLKGLLLAIALAVTLYLWKLPLRECDNLPPDEISSGFSDP